MVYTWGSVERVIPERRSDDSGRLPPHAYMAHHGIVQNDDPVVVFEGQQVGTGPDGEPLAVPTGDIRWITWRELVALTKEAEA